jgi:hypothetical protein
MLGALLCVCSSQRSTNAAKFLAWSTRYGSDGKPSRDVGGSLCRMASGVEYDGGIGGAGEVEDEIEQM